MDSTVTIIEKYIRICFEAQALTKSSRYSITCPQNILSSPISIRYSKRNDTRKQKTGSSGGCRVVDSWLFSSCAGVTHED